MKRRSINTTLLAVVIAVVLFLIANHFDTKTPWQPDAQPPASMNPARDSGVAGPLRTVETAGRCDAAENDMREAVAAAQYCSTDV
jgi:hypothetical protein